MHDFGPSDAAGPLTVTDTLPADLTFVSMSSTDGWSCSALGQDLTCSRAAGLANGATTTFRVVVAIAASSTGNIHNTAHVDGPTPDANPANDDESDDTAVGVEADLGIVKTLTTSPVVAGRDVSYDLVVHNRGPAVSPGTITVIDTLPAGLTFVSAAGGPTWSCSAAGQTVTCNRATSLAVGAQAPTITLVAHVASGIGTTSLLNVATVTGPVTDPGPDPNTSSVLANVTELAEISVTKTVTGPDPVRAGERHLPGGGLQCRALRRTVGHRLRRPARRDDARLDGRRPHLGLHHHRVHHRPDRRRHVRSADHGRGEGRRWYAGRHQPSPTRST